MSKSFRQGVMRLLAGVLLAGICGLTSSINAASFSPRKVTLSNQNPSQTAVTYTFTFTPQSAATVKRIEFQVGTAAGNTTVPTGMVTTSASLTTASGLGSGGSWATDATTNGLLKISNPLNGGSPTNTTVAFNLITNPSVSGTYYFRVTTYDTASGGAVIDQDDVAFPITPSTVTVSGFIDETLSFALSSTAINLGRFSSTAINSASHTMTAATNATSGYGITGQGSTLTSGSNTIPFVSDGAVTIGSPEYGVAYSGAAGHPAGDVGLNSSTVVASRNTATSDTTTATYKVSISDLSPAGSYVSQITYICSANF